VKQLYDWFWDYLDEQETLYGQRTVAGLAGMVVLAAGLLLLWLLVLACGWLGLNG
jgi:hypothetical protein